MEKKAKAEAKRTRRIKRKQESDADPSLDPLADEPTTTDDEWESPEPAN